jgi:hypothetical protein
LFHCNGRTLRCEGEGKLTIVVTVPSQASDRRDGNNKTLARLVELRRLFPHLIELLGSRLPKPLTSSGSFLSLRRLRSRCIQLIA